MVYTCPFPTPFISDRVLLGDIIYSRILNQDIIILNSEKVARALLEQRSNNYSDRPRFVTMELQALDHIALRPTNTPLQGLALRLGQSCEATVMLGVDTGKDGDCTLLGVPYAAHNLDGYSIKP